MLAIDLEATLEYYNQPPNLGGVDVTACPRWYRAFCAYIGLSLMVSVAYWPELLPGYDDVFAPFLVGVLLLRTVACLEALHVQTREFPRWSRMMAGAFLMGFAVVLMLHGVRDDKWAGLAVELRRYLQIWLAVAMCAVQLMLYDRGWPKQAEIIPNVINTKREITPVSDKLAQSFHAHLLTMLAVNHGAVSVWAMRSHPEGAGWLNLNAASTAVDAAVYLMWAFGRKHEASRD